MLKKNYTKSGRSCRVTFKLPAEASAEQVSLLGEFNSWDQEAHPMKKLKDGSFSVTVSLEAGQEYPFRYLLDGERWENDAESDKLQPSPFGVRNSVVAL